VTVMKKLIESIKNYFKPKVKAVNFANHDRKKELKQMNKNDIIMLALYYEKLISRIVRAHNIKDPTIYMIDEMETKPKGDQNGVRHEHSTLDRKAN